MSRTCFHCDGPLKIFGMNIGSIDVQEHGQNQFETTLINGVCEKATLYTAEPDMVNPNSYESVSLVLRNTGFRAGIFSFSFDRFSDNVKSFYLLFGILIYCNI